MHPRRAKQSAFGPSRPSAGARTSPWAWLSSSRGAKFWTALAIFLFLISATLIFHDFWAVEPEQVTMQLIQFQKNLAIMGGMLYVVFNGPGRMSLDRV